MKTLLAGVAGLTLLAGVAYADDAKPIPAAPGALSVEDTTIGDLIADTGGHAVLQKDMPKLLAYDGLDMIKGMTLRGISAFPQAELNDDKLAAIQKDLDAAAPKK